MHPMAIALPHLGTRLRTCKLCFEPKDAILLFMLSQTRSDTGQQAVLERNGRSDH